MRNFKHKIPLCPKNSKKLSISKYISNINIHLNNPKTAKNSKNLKKSLSPIKRSNSATSVEKTSKNLKKKNTLSVIIPNFKTCINQNIIKKKISLIKINPKSYKIPFDFKEIKKYDNKKRKNYLTKNQNINSNKKNFTISNNSRSIQLNEDPFQFTFGETNKRSYSNSKIMKSNTFSQTSLRKTKIQDSYSAKNKNVKIISKKNFLIKPLYPKIRTLSNNLDTLSNNEEFFKCIDSNSENKYSTVDCEKSKKNNNTLEKLMTFFGNNFKSCNENFSNNHKDKNVKTYYGHQMKFSTGLIPIDKNHTIFKKHKIIVKKRGKNEECKDMEGIYSSNNGINSNKKISANKKYKFVLTKFTQQIKLNSCLRIPKILIKHPSFHNFFKN